MDLVAALSGRDIDTLQRAITRYRALGLEAALDLTSREEGRAVIWHIDPRQRTASTYQLEIRKYWTGIAQPRWIIIVSCSNGLSMTMRRMGQVSSNVLLFALTKVEQTISSGRTVDGDQSVRRNALTQSELAKLDKLAATLSASIGYPRAKAAERSVHIRPRINGDNRSKPGYARLSRS